MNTGFAQSHDPKKRAVRIFQRCISTLNGSGRRLGASSIKVFGENVLDGKIDFNTSAAEGTAFGLHLPRRRVAFANQCRQQLNRP